MSFRRITNQAISKGRVSMVPACGVNEMTHCLYLGPRCPVSRNPIAGMLRVTYAPNEHSLEVVSLKELIASRLEFRNVEGLVSGLANILSDALGVSVKVKAYLLVRPMQILIVQS
jgi:NADPH-dependent 7-cyano-7-deazaguanine reductase QueF